jgi:hypothetical protein
MKQTVRSIGSNIACRSIHRIYVFLITYEGDRVSGNMFSSNGPALRERFIFLRHTLLFPLLGPLVRQVTDMDE